HDRITGGEAEEMIDTAYSAWRADRARGLVSVLIAESRDDVTELNQRARADLILDGTLTPGREVDLHDGTTAGVGATIITRRNDRRLRNATTGSATANVGPSPESATTGRSPSADRAGDTAGPSSCLPPT